MALFRWTCSPVMDETRRLVGDQALGADLGVAAEVVVPRLHRHHDFFQRTVAGPFADAVDRAFDLAGPVFDGRQAVGHRQSQIVVAVDADHRLVDVGHPVLQHGDAAAHFRRRGVAHGVRDVDGRGPGLDRRLDDLAQKVVFGAGRVLRRKLHVVAVLDGPLHAGHGPLDDLFAGHPQLEFAMDRAGRQEHVDPRPRGLLQRLPGPVDVRFVAASQAAHRGSANRLGDLAAPLRNRRARRSENRPR